jgi:hypothetical protein
MTSKAVEEALHSLPPTLDASYKRNFIANSSRTLTSSSGCPRICCLLTFSKRPPTLDEVAEAAAAGSSDGLFDTENRFFEPELILTMCSSLLILEDSVADNVLASDEHLVRDSISLSNDTETEECITNEPRVRPAHYTVSEYLQSSHIQTGPANIFAMSADTENSSLARIYLRCLLLFDISEPLGDRVGRDFPLSHFAAIWPVLRTGLHYSSTLARIQTGH